MSLGQVDGQAGAARLLAAGRWTTGMCLEAVWNTLGAGTSDSPGSYNTAKDWWDRCPTERKRVGDRNPPAGALLRFGNGNAAGHICYSLGGENAVSTDKPSSGLTGRTTISDIEQSWGGRTYEGWTDWLGGWDVVNLGYPHVAAVAAESSIKAMEAIIAVPNGVVTHFMPGQRTDFVSPDDYNDYRSLVGGLHTGNNGQPATDLFLPPELASVTGVTWDRFVKLCEHFGVPTGRPANQDAWLAQKFVGFTPTPS